MDALLQQARAMQDQVMAARAAAAEQVVEGQAGGGAVKVRVTGAMEFESVTIDAKAMDPADPTMLEDLVMAACNDAVGRARALSEQALGGLGVGLSDLGLGDADLGGPALGGPEPGGPEPGGPAGLH